MPRIVLLASLLKGGDFELLLRGATETGVSAIIPIEAARSVPRIKTGEKAKKVARWERILEEATRQCGASRVPSVGAPVPLEKAIEMDLPPLRLAGILEEGTAPLATVAPADEAAIAIGPEGDWDDREKEILRKAGFSGVSLGPLVLKACTAAIVACSHLVLAWEGQGCGETQGEKIPDQGSRMPDKPV
jgi:16S rRNA (uracil1498-N3)-methyltransferase